MHLKVRRNHSLRQFLPSIASLLCVVALEIGCDNRPSPPKLPASLPAPTIVHWKVVGVAQLADLKPGQRPLDLTVEIEGPPGFARVSLVTDKAVTGLPPASYLNDVLFPISDQANLAASLHLEDRQARIEVMTRGEESTAILPTHDLGNVPWTFETAMIAETTQQIGEGHEVPLGRWICRNGSDSWTLTLRVLLSRDPVGPRLKPEGKPPR